MTSHIWTKTLPILHDLTRIYARLRLMRRRENGMLIRHHQSLLRVCSLVRL